MVLTIGTLESFGPTGCVGEKADSLVRPNLGFHSIVGSTKVQGETRDRWFFKGDNRKKLIGEI